MKKLSVLLVIGLFCIPMMVYGFTKTGLPSVISNSISKGYHTIVKIASRSQDRSTSLIQPQAETETPTSLNPFFKEPFGAKGLVSGIDIANKSITLQNAVYFDFALNQSVTSDLTVFMNDMTTYYMDLDESSVFDSITVGSTVICNGPVDYKTKEIKFAYDVYMGKFIPDDAKAVLNFTANIKNFDAGNRSFDFEFIGVDGHVFTIRVKIDDATPIFSLLKDSPDIPTGPVLGVIPDFVKNDTVMSGDFIITQDLTAVANLIYFYEY